MNSKKDKILSVPSMKAAIEIHLLEHPPYITQKRLGFLRPFSLKFPTIRIMQTYSLAHLRIEARLIHRKHPNSAEATVPFRRKICKIILGLHRTQNKANGG